MHRFPICLMLGLVLAIFLSCGHLASNEKVAADNTKPDDILIQRDEFKTFDEEPQLLEAPDPDYPEMAQKAGIKIYCDFTLTSPHMASHRVTEQTYRTFCEVNPIPQEELIDV